MDELRLNEEPLFSVLIASLGRRSLSQCGFIYGTNFPWRASQNYTPNDFDKNTITPGCG